MDVSELLTADDPVDVDVRQVISDLVSALHSEVAQRRDALNSRRERDARTSLMLARDSLERAVTTELAAAGDKASVGGVLGRLGVQATAHLPGQQPVAASVLVHADLPIEGSFAERWQTARLSAHALLAGTHDHWVELAD